ncbi:hypothetical protein, partial [Nocardia abscessus]|uniref:hypothetical protein n=1 Tax=Nocardia abscessus TaxID=120957 RepID=UPI0024556F76
MTSVPHLPSHDGASERREPLRRSDCPACGQCAACQQATVAAPAVCERDRADAANPRDRELIARPDGEVIAPTPPAHLIRRFRAKRDRACTVRGPGGGGGGGGGGG